MSVVAVGTGCTEERLGGESQRPWGYSCGHWRGRSGWLCWSGRTRIPWRRLRTIHAGSPAHRAHASAPGGSRAARPLRCCSAL